MSNKKDIVLANIKAEIDKIENKKNRIEELLIENKQILGEQSNEKDA